MQKEEEPSNVGTQAAEKKETSISLEMKELLVDYSSSHEAQIFLNSRAETEEAI